MKPFSADWLAAREPHDQRARNRAVLDALVGSLAALSSIQVVDLGCGTGSTLRALAPRLPARQHWQLIDNDLGLLERAARLDRPGAAKAAIGRFERAGYRVAQGRSDWRLQPDDCQMQTAVLEAWAGAASEASALPLAEVVGWLTRRRDLVAAGRSAMHLGHVDFLALPDDNGSPEAGD